ncbi:nucleotidyltransferase [Streptococcus anginosus]|uniref:nucleotidyltransferase domain-containing protein n=1 Tax=Streptococcus anginosus TaxID=1328 RepID=UPI0022E26EC0|nr:nucleotidyltransferase [Streptococcus anginosus]
MDKDSIIIEAMAGIELSLTMEKNAREKYKAIYNYIESKGLEYDFIPQGSFLIGTAIRPFRGDKDGNYDLDVLTISRSLKTMITPGEVKNKLGDCLKDNQIYANKLETEDENCWTLQYAEVSDGIGFALDLVPAVNEVVDNLIPYNDKIVFITQKSNNSYDWRRSNSLGFGDWFLDINKNFLTTELMERQSRSLIENHYYATIDDIPKYAYKTNLQRAIQFVKRHRDMFFSKNNGNKPSTILVTALITDSVKTTPFLSISDIISQFVKDFQSDSISIKKKSKVTNPVDSFDNLADGMTSRDWQAINDWIVKLGELINSTNERNIKLSLQRNINPKAFGDLSKITTKNIVPVKPWRAVID